MKRIRFTKEHAVFLPVSLFVIVSDQVTKFLIRDSLGLYETIPVIEGLFNITYIRNPGAAFGFLSGASPFFRSLFLTLITVAVIALIIYILGKNDRQERLLHVSLSLVLGGAIGNLIDRIVFGEVTDFIDLYIGSAHWPAFNIADMAISAGAFMLIFEMIKKGRNQRR
ncbi:MAG: signal peptidase II [Syntrophales bacterium]|jgi:signal peptidase II|nr:signal peptidase II [Syntrophales bacterium]MDY0043506.1 signal peptidase II [Syntrophales bacterium]